MHLLKKKLGVYLEPYRMSIGNTVTHAYGIGNNCQYPVYYHPEGVDEIQQCGYININSGLYGEGFPAGATLYAMWVTTEYDFPYTGNYVQFVIPQDGIYEFEVWGASGAAAKVDTLDDI